MEPKRGGWLLIANMGTHLWQLPQMLHGIAWLGSVLGNATAARLLRTVYVTATAGHVNCSKAVGPLVPWKNSRPLVSTHGQTPLHPGDVADG